MEALFVGLSVLSAHTILSRTAYKSLRVIDGDTFETTENQLVRINGIDAPETEMCGGEKARETLGKLVMNKPLNIKVLRRDPYYRLVSDVYADGKSVAAMMLSSGNAVRRITNEEINKTELNAAQDYAKVNKIGIFGEECTQSSNPKNNKCNIKGNRRSEHTDRFYRYPGCSQYDNTVVQLHLGDMWFCSEKEAKTAGFKKGGDCL
jgi:endonuclease YncB( thermonuclease family)